MIAVSNTSPLKYLTLIERVGVLPSLFNPVHVPQSVARELAHELAPQAVRSWIASPPHWLRIQDPIAPDLTVALDAGERDAISLAIELGADVVLIDDGAARRIATSRGLRVVGTLGLLELADLQGLADLPADIQALQRTSYRIHANVVQSLLEAHSRRHAAPGHDAD